MESFLAESARHLSNAIETVYGILPNPRSEWLMTSQETLKLHTTELLATLACHHCDRSQMRKRLDIQLQVVSCKTKTNSLGALLSHL